MKRPRKSFLLETRAARSEGPTRAGPVIFMNHGIQFEQEIQELLERIFLPDLVFRNPSYLKGGRIKRELADLIIPLGTSVLAFQVRATQSMGTNDVQLHRFSRKIDHAVSQFKTLREAIRQDKKILARSSRGAEIPIEFDSDTKVTGVIVVNRPLKNLAAHSKAKALGYLELGGMPVHVFHRRDLELVLSHLATLPELLHYLRVRKAIFGRGEVVGYKSESTLLWLHINRPRLIEEACLMERPVLFAPPPSPLAPKRVTLSQHVFRERRRLGRMMIDHIAGILYEAMAPDKRVNIPAWAGELGIDVPTTNGYWMIQQELAALPSSSKEVLGEKLVEKMIKADRVGFGFSLFIPSFEPVLEAKEKGSLKFGQDAILIYAAKDQRRDRIQWLSTVAEIALCGYGLRQIWGVTTEPWSVEQHYYDFVFKRTEKCSVDPVAAEMVGKYFGKETMEGQLPPGTDVNGLKKRFPGLAVFPMP